jgi:hypothetical protein
LANAQVKDGGGPDPDDVFGFHPPLGFQCQQLPSPSGAALRAKAPPFGNLAPLACLLNSWHIGSHLSRRPSSI